MFQIYSNLLYLCSAAAALSNGRWTWACVMAAVTVCSVLYHSGGLNRQVDVAVAVFAFFYGCLLYATSRSRPLSVPFFTVCMFVCLWFPKHSIADYDAVHPWAHVFGGLASLTLAAR